MKSCSIQRLFLLCLSLFTTLATETLAGEASVETLKALAEKGDNSAQFQLGKSYERGEGVPQDVAKAVEFYRKAAEQGNFKAQHNLGLMYLEGRGVKKDESEAAKWFRLAAVQGAALSQDALGSMLAKGKGVPKDCKEAATWYRKAVEQDLLSAQMHLGELYYFGDEGVPQDYTAAAPLLLKAAERGNAWAQNTVGAMKENGQGFAMNVGEAAAWFRQAAEQGDARGRFNLGRAYTVGTLGVKKDPAKAYMWLKLSTEQGGTPAKGFLMDFRKSMSAEEIAEGERLVLEFHRRESPVNKSQ